MKATLLTLFSLLALLLVSTAVLADGRPTGIRIGRAVSGGGTNVEIDVTITGTWSAWNAYSSTVWIGNAWSVSPNDPYIFYQFSGTNTTALVPLPFAVDWGDGNYVGNATLFGTSGGPWQGTFAHTYSVPGSYVITAGDMVCCGAGGSNYVYTGNVISGSTRTFGRFDPSPGTFFPPVSVPYTYPQALAITATATVTTGTGIPTLNIYGLLAMAFVLVGAGLLVFRKPQQA